MSIELVDSLSVCGIIYIENLEIAIILHVDGPPKIFLFFILK